MAARQRISLYLIASALVFLMSAQAVAQQAGAGEKRVTISLQDTPVRSAIDMIFREAGVNYAFEGGTQGTVNVNLTDVPFDQAVAIILRSAGLTMSMVRGTYMIGPKKEVEAYVETAPTLAAEETEIARTTSLEKIRVNFADVMEIGAIFGAEYRGGSGFGGGGYTGGYGMTGGIGGYGGMGGMSSYGGMGGMGSYGMTGGMGGYGSSYGSGMGGYGSSYGGAMAGYGSSYGGMSGFGGTGTYGTGNTGIRRRW